MDRFLNLLRIQIMASKQHKEMKKGRKEGVDILQHIRTMQESNKSPKGEEGVGSSRGASGRKLEKENDFNRKQHKNSVKVPQEQVSSNEAEIQRLTTMRSGMLSTGAYTKYDMVIKEMERRIVGLAEGKISK